VEVIEEENYFFKFSVFQEYLLEHYAQHPDFVVPGFRFNEIKAFVARGLEDFSISRRKDKMPWGVPVPNDDSQVMYVWFDALVNYISALGWPEDEANFKEWWVDTGGVVQCAGKDQVRQQAAMWQAMLKAAGLPPSKQIVIHGFITSGGQKMSKSLGNAADPVALVREYGTDALRWYLARHIHPFEDSDFTMEKFRETYNADLANGVGNVVSRVMKMAVDYRVAPPAFSDKMERMRGLEKYINGYDIKAAAEVIFGAVVNIDRHIQEHEPYKMYKSNPDAAREVVQKLVLKLYEVGVLIEPILPATGVEIQRLVRENTMPVVPLFPRKS
jgi:methionyl-tRNA synthetase